MLGAGACIDSQSFNGGTPLMRAIETSQRSIIKLLLEKGYDILQHLYLEQSSSLILIL